MNEMQIQLYWLNRSASLKEVQTVSGISVVILFPGFLNLQQGPDFLHARILLDEIEWTGSVEIHQKSSDWFLHQHSNDPNYKNVILHVVWINDLTFFDQCPVLELSKYVSCNALNTQSLLSSSIGSFPLKPNLELLEHMAIQRMEEKANKMLVDLKCKKGDWNAVLWKRIAYAFGLPLNADAFENIMEQALKLISFRRFSHESELLNLMLHLSGLFQNGESSVNLVHQKYLSKIETGSVKQQFLFFRIRPCNTPQKRMKALAKLFFKNRKMMRAILEEPSLKNLYSSVFEIGVSFELFHRIVINAFVPFLIAYAKHKGDIRYRVRAVEWLRKLPPEKNKIIGDFSKEHFSVQSALHSQGIIALKTTSN